jgi:hypothetical protein
VLHTALYARCCILLHQVWHTKLSYAEKIFRSRLFFYRISPYCTRIAVVYSLEYRTYTASCTHNRPPPCQYSSLSTPSKYRRFTADPRTTEPRIGLLSEWTEPRKGTQPQMDPTPNGLNTEWTEPRKEPVPNELSPEWTQPPRDAAQNGLNSEWTELRMD